MSAEHAADLAALGREHGRRWAAEDEAHEARLLLLRVALHVGVVTPGEPAVVDPAEVARRLTAWLAS